MKRAAIAILLVVHVACGADDEVPAPVPWCHQAHGEYQVAWTMVKNTCNPVIKPPWGLPSTIYMFGDWCDSADVSGWSWGPDKYPASNPTCSTWWTGRKRIIDYGITQETVRGTLSCPYGGACEVVWDAVYTYIP